MKEQYIEDMKKMMEEHIVDMMRKMELEEDLKKI